MPDLGISNDYAVLTATTPTGGKWQLYYGYEYAHLLKLDQKTGNPDDEDAGDGGDTGKAG